MDWITPANLAIPFIAGLIGYATNWLAVQMTFYPHDFVGLKEPWLGWQGIIPSKAKKMAAISVDSSLRQLGSLSEIFDQMNPDRIADHVLHYIDAEVEPLVQELMQERYPDLWRSLPTGVKELVYARVRAELPERTDAMMADIGEHIDQLMDLKLMVVDELGKDKDLLNRMFKETGDEEFTFLIRSGAYFGFAFGLVQMAVWIVVQQWWILPLFGLFVGYATNKIALTIIFNPKEPTKVGPFTFQGLFMKRQDEVAATFSSLVTEEVLTLRNFVRAMLEGPKSDRTHALIRRHTMPLIDDAAGVAAPAARVAVGSQRYDAMKEEVGRRALELTPAAFDDPVFNAERGVMVEKMMCERMTALSPDEFQELLRPAFQEDESKLIAAGAVLGGLAGLAQAVFLF